MNKLIPAVQEINIHAGIENWLKYEIANSDARPDTIYNYRLWIEQWFAWCQTNNVNPGSATRQHVEAYRSAMIKSGLAASSIGNKLTIVRQFYQSAVNHGLLSINPAAGVKPPIDRRVKEKKKNLTEKEAMKLLSTLPSQSDNRPNALRDRIIIVLGLLEGLRRIEIHRANVEDIEQYFVEDENGEYSSNIRIYIHGKRNDRYCYPRRDTIELLLKYIQSRDYVDRENVAVGKKQKLVTPLFCNLSKGGKNLNRISRRGLNWIVDSYLKKAGLKSEDISCHALRHSCGYLPYKETKDYLFV